MLAGLWGEAVEQRSATPWRWAYSSKRSPNGFFNTEADSLYIIADTAYTGWYHLRNTDPTACDTVNDSIYITIHTSFYQQTLDTIVENQLPWQRFGISFHNDFDTTFIRPTGLENCDSIIVTTQPH